MDNQISKFKISTKSLAAVSLLCAISIILARVFGIVVPIAGFPALKLNFAFLPLLIAGMYYGPTAGFLCGMVADILGYMINPMGGAFFPGFTLTTALCGAIPGVLEKYIDKIKHLKIINSLFVLSLSTMFFIVLFLSGTLSFASGSIYYGDSQVSLILVVIALAMLFVYILLPFIMHKLFSDKYHSVDKIYFIVTVTYIITTVILNTFFLSYYFGKGFLVFLPVRLITAYIMIPLNTLLILIVIKTLKLKHGENKNGL
jgi:ECF transporter S component (folate family)